MLHLSDLPVNTMGRPELMSNRRRCSHDLSINLFCRYGVLQIYARSLLLAVPGAVHLVRACR
jgi:hypothetical protein